MPDIKNITITPEILNACPSIYMSFIGLP